MFNNVLFMNGKCNDPINPLKSQLLVIIPRCTVVQNLELVANDSKYFAVYFIFITIDCFQRLAG